MSSSDHSVMDGLASDEVLGAAAGPVSDRIRAYFDLRDALAEPGCPVCARVLRAGREAVARLAAGMALAAARTGSPVFAGLCNVHTQSLGETAPAAIGPGDAYERILRMRIETLQRACSRIARAQDRSWLARLWAWRPPRHWRRRCPACRTAETVERGDLRLLLDLITDGEFARAFEASSGLCLPHLDLVLRLAPGHPNRTRLLDAHTPKLKRLQADFQDWLRRAKAPLPTLAPGEAEAVWARLLAWMEGQPSVFGPERDLAPQGSGWRRLLRRAYLARASNARAADHGRAEKATDDAQRLELENEKLQRRLVEVSREWAEESARRAALQYQVHKLSEDVRVLELNLAGARGEAQSGELQAARLRAEIDALRGQVDRLRSRREDAQTGPGG